MSNVVGGPIPPLSMKLCTKAGLEESHFVWRIENFEHAIRREFMETTLGFTAIVGDSLDHQLEFTFQLEQLDPLEEDEKAELDRLRAERQTAQDNLDTATEALGRDNGSRRRRLRELEVAVQQAEERLQEILVTLRPLEQRPPPGSGSSYIRLACRFDCPFSLPLISKRLQVLVRRLTGNHFDFDSKRQPETEVVQKNGTSGFWEQEEDGGWELPKLIENSRADVKKLLLVDEALRIEIKLSLSQARDAGEEAAAYKSPIVSWLPELIMVNDKMTVTLGCSGVDEEQHLSYKALLPTRSSTLAGLILRNPEQSIFKLDVSPGTLRILVRYLHTGLLPPSGFSSYSEILDVASAAVKYGLPELLSYCDEILADYCNMDTASYLLVKSRETKLFRSSKAIMDYIRGHHSTTNIGFNIKNPHPANIAYETARGGKEAGMNPAEMMNHNYTINEIFTTGVRREVKPITWEIGEFKQLLINFHPQPATFQTTKITGCRFNQEAKWGLSLRRWEKDKGSKIKIELTCKYLSSSTTAAAAEEVDRSNVHFYVDVAFGADPSITEQWSSKNLVPLEEPSTLSVTTIKENCPFTNASGGTLNVELQLVVLSNHQNNNDSELTTRGCRVLRDFGQSAMDKLESGMESLYKSMPIFTDVTIISKEGHQFFAHWRILAGRCAAFKSMFDSGLEERRSGIIKVDDIPRNAVDIMLCYIYTGRIAVGSFSTAMDFTDVAYVAEKYDLSGLRRYADDNLVRKVNLTNVRELMSAAVTYRLSNAQAAIRNFIWSEVSNPSEYSDLLASSLSN